MSASEGDGRFDRKGALAILGDDEELFREIRDMFLDEAPGWLSQLESLVKEKKAEEVREAAHQIKGAISQFCAKKAQQSALQLEKQGEDKKVDLLADTFGDLKVATELLISDLKSA